MSRTTKLLIAVSLSLLAVGLAAASVTAFGGAADVQTQEDPESVSLDGDATSVAPEGCLSPNGAIAPDCGSGGDDDDGGGGGGEFKP